jgi:hypothetical protein
MNVKEATGFLKQLRDLKAFTREHPPLTQRHQRISAAELASLSRQAVGGN